MEPKTLLKSKTFWIACLQAIVGVLAVFTSAYPTVGSLLIAKSFMDILIRVYTDRPIA